MNINQLRAINSILNQKYRSEKDPDERERIRNLIDGVTNELRKFERAIHSDPPRVSYSRIYLAMGIIFCIVFMIILYAQNPKPEKKEVEPRVIMTRRIITFPDGSHQVLEEYKQEKKK